MNRIVANYIGDNALMKMVIALYIKKPIFLFNEFTEEPSFLEEKVGMLPFEFYANIYALPKEYKKLDARLLAA